jgi:hypothetical protein
MAAAGVAMGYGGVQEIKAGDKFDGYRHVGEAAAMIGSAAGGPQAMIGVGEGVGAIEAGFQANEDRKAKRYGDEAVHGTEAAMFTLGVASLAVPGLGLLGAVGFGLVGAGLEVGNRWRHYFLDKHVEDRTGNPASQPSGAPVFEDATATFAPVEQPSVVGDRQPMQSSYDVRTHAASGPVYSASAPSPQRPPSSFGLKQRGM